jgi:hypothetical protein
LFVVVLLIACRGGGRNNPKKRRGFTAEDTEGAEKISWTEIVGEKHALGAVRELEMAGSN